MDAKQFAGIIKNIDVICERMGIKKQVQIMSCDNDEYCADYIEYQVTGREEVDAPLLKYCNQHGIKLMVNSDGSEYLNNIIRKHRIIIVREGAPEDEPGLGMWFTYVSPEGEETTISQLEILKDGQFDFDGYEAEFREAKKWVDEHPGSYITSGENVIYRGNVYQILGQLSLLDGAEKEQATSVFN